MRKPELAKARRRDDPGERLERAERGLRVRCSQGVSRVGLAVSAGSSSSSSSSLCFPLPSPYARSTREEEGQQGSSELSRPPGEFDRLSARRCRAGWLASPTLPYKTLLLPRRASRRASCKGELASRSVQPLTGVLDRLPALQPSSRRATDGSPERVWLPPASVSARQRVLRTPSRFTAERLLETRSARVASRSSETRRQVDQRRRWRKGMGSAARG